MNINRLKSFVLDASPLPRMVKKNQVLNHAPGSIITNNNYRRELLLSYLRASHTGDITANILQGVVQDLEHIQPVVSV